MRRDEDERTNLPDQRHLREEYLLLASLFIVRHIEVLLPPCYAPQATDYPRIRATTAGYSRFDIYEVHRVDFLMSLSLLFLNLTTSISRPKAMTV